MQGIILEICGSRRILDQYIELTSNYVDCFDVPESPLGIPCVNSIATCVYLKTRYNVCCIAHIRLHDINGVALHSLAMAAETFDIEGLVLTIGDKPRIGFSVGQYDTVSAINSLKKSRYRIKIGAIISLRYDVEDIVDRLKIDADFFLVLRLGVATLDKYIKIYKAANKVGKRLYPYIIVATNRNRELLAKIDQPYFEASDIEEFIKEIRKYSDGLIISIPKGGNEVQEILRIAREVFHS